MILIVLIGSIIGSFFGAYAVSLFADKFLSTDVDVAIIRMIEGLNQGGRPKQTPTILKGLQEDERLRVLERVLDSRPYSKELGAQVKLEREKAEENERMQQMENALLKKDPGTDTDFDTSQKSTDLIQDNEQEDVKIDDNVSSDDNDNFKDNDEKAEETNILQRVWKEFGDRGNGNKNIKKKDEVTETCAICMDDYEENQTVIIGDNCIHMYHKECLLKWMKAKHDFCPYCRSYVFPVSNFISIAKEQVGEERFKTLVEEDDPELVAMYIGPNGNSSTSPST